MSYADNCQKCEKLKLISPEKENGHTDLYECQVDGRTIDFEDWDGIGGFDCPRSDPKKQRREQCKE